MVEKIRAGSASWWVRQLVAATRAAKRDPSPITLALLRSISQAARAASSHMGVEELEAKTAELEARQREIESTRSRGTGKLGAVVSLSFREGQKDMYSGPRTPGSAEGA